MTDMYPLSDAEIIQLEELEDQEEYRRAVEEVRDEFNGGGAWE